MHAQDNEYLDLEGYDPKDLVIVAITDSLDQAEQIRDLLADHDIPALIADTDDEQAPRGRAVKTPQEAYDEAREIIEEYESLEDMLDEDDEDLEEDDEDDDRPSYHGFQELDDESDEPGPRRSRPKRKSADDEDEIDLEEDDEPEVEIDLYGEEEDDLGEMDDEFDDEDV